MNEALFDGMDDQKNVAGSQPVATESDRRRSGAVRTRMADRSQVGMHFCSIDELVSPDHQVRVIWEAVCNMDVSAFETPIRSREFTAGRPANEARVMIGLWLWAAVNNVSRGRRIEVLCERDLTFRWMCGGLSMNYHTLNDFRVGHQAALDELFTAMLGRLMHAQLVSVTRISQDGLRTRASAGTGSFRRRPTLEACLVEAEAHLADLKKRGDAADQAADQREGADRSDDVDGKRDQAIAQDRVDRVRQALSEMTRVEAAKAKQSNRQKRENPPRVSTTDPEARVMKMANGGFNPAYNVQFAVDPHSRAIVGVEVSNCGGDAPLSEPLRRQVEKRTGQKVSEHLLDGGYVNLQAIDRAALEQVTIYMPVPEPNKNSELDDRHARRESDTDAVADWRTLMSTPEAKEIYQQRASSNETVNADLRTYRGMAPFSVRGIAKTTCVALWSALAYNILTFAGALT